MTAVTFELFLRMHKYYRCFVTSATIFLKLFGSVIPLGNLINNEPIKTHLSKNCKPTLNLKGLACRFETQEENIKKTLSQKSASFLLILRKFMRVVFVSGVQKLILPDLQATYRPGHQ